jgi:hypothetical protein
LPAEPRRSVLGFKVLSGQKPKPLAAATLASVLNEVLQLAFEVGLRAQVNAVVAWARSGCLPDTRPAAVDNDVLLGKFVERGWVMPPPPPAAGAGAAARSPPAQHSDDDGHDVDTEETEEVQGAARQLSALHGRSAAGAAEGRVRKATGDDDNESDGESDGKSGEVQDTSDRDDVEGCASHEEAEGEEKKKKEEEGTGTAAARPAAVEAVQQATNRNGVTHEAAVRNGSAAHAHVVSPAAAEAATAAQPGAALAVVAPGTRGSTVARDTTTHPRDVTPPTSAAKSGKTKRKPAHVSRSGSDGARKRQRRRILGKHLCFLTLLTLPHCPPVP